METGSAFEGMGAAREVSYAVLAETALITAVLSLSVQSGSVTLAIMLAPSVGAGAGLIAAVLASRALASFLYETSPRDPWVLAGSVVALTFIASAASILPALRAARIDPMQALRND